MFEFLEMMGNYEDRKIANDEINGAIIDTCYVNDSEQDYETGICHPDYNNNNWIIVETYETKELAEIGHKKWVVLFEKELPEYLKDVSSAEIKKFGEALNAIEKEEKFYRINKG